MRASVLPLLLVLGLPALAAQPNPPGAPGAQPPQVEEAVEKYQGGDLEGAIAVLEPLRGKPGTHPAALSLLGALYLEAGRADDSLAILGPLADGAAAGPVILHNAARAARAVGQMAKAEAYLERAVAKAPVSPASRELGILRGSQGRIAESYRLLRPWALANPGDREVRLSAAYGAVELARPAEAEELLKDLPQDNPAVQLLRGRLHLAAKRPQDALNAAEAALQTAPGNPGFLHLRGAARLALYQLPAAEKDFRQVLQAEPDHVAALNDLAVLLMTVDRNDEARQLLRKVLEVKPGDEMATANLKSLEEP